MLLKRGSLFGSDENLRMNDSVNIQRLCVRPRRLNVRAVQTFQGFFVLFRFCGKIERERGDPPHATTHTHTHTRKKKSYFQNEREKVQQ